MSSNEKVYRKAIESALYYGHEHKLSPFFSIRYGLRLSMYQNIGAETFYLFDDNYNLYDSIIYSSGQIFNTEVNLEPRLAMMYQLGATSSVKASYSRTVQYAQIASNATGGLPFDVWFPSSPNIKPQKCDQFAVGYFRNFRGNDIETSAEIFYKNLTDVIDFKDDAAFYGNVLIDGEVRVGRGRSYGAEFIIRKNYGKLTGWISYTYSRSFRTVKGISHDEEYSSPYDRPHCIRQLLLVVPDAVVASVGLHAPGCEVGAEGLVDLGRQLLVSHLRGPLSHEVLDLVRVFINHFLPVPPPVVSIGGIVPAALSVW